MILGTYNSLNQTSRNLLNAINSGTLTEVLSAVDAFNKQAAKYEELGSDKAGSLLIGCLARTFSGSSMFRYPVMVFDSTSHQTDIPDEILSLIEVLSSTRVLRFDYEGNPDEQGGTYLYLSGHANDPTSGYPVNENGALKLYATQNSGNAVLFGFQVRAGKLQWDMYTPIWNNVAYLYEPDPVPLGVTIYSTYDKLRNEIVNGVSKYFVSR